MQNQVWGMLYRLLEVTSHAAPTVLVGFFLAGVIKRLIGYETTKAWFGGDSLRSIPQAWLIGMLLPVCSLGALPVIRQLHKAGVPGGAILAFAISAPLFNPISLLYGLSLANPVVIISFAALSLFIVTLVGLLVEKVLPFPAHAAEDVPPVSYGIRRLMAVAVTAAREAWSRQVGFILLGLLGSAGLSLFLPYGFLQNKAERVDVWAPLFMASVALPVYETPMTMIIKLGDMFQHGNSVGAAFALMILGAGINLGVFLWLWLHYGKLRTFGCVGVLFLVVVGLSYSVDGPLTPRGVEPAGHTHAFDVYCSPFHPAENVGIPLVMERFSKNLQLFEIVGLIGWALLLAVGWMVRTSKFPDLDTWLEQPVDRTGSWDIVLPPQVLGGVGLLGLIVASVFGCFLYYPPLDEIFEELKQSQIPLVSAGVTQDWEGVNYWLPIVDDWTRRVQVSAYLRRIPQSDDHAARAESYRDLLDGLRHAAEDRDIEEARRYGLAIQRAYSELKAVYLNTTTRGNAPLEAEETGAEEAGPEEAGPEEAGPEEAGVEPPEEAENPAEMNR